MLFNRTAYVLQLHPQRNPQQLVYFRVNIYRNGSAKHQRIDHAFMYISGQYNLIPRFARGENHALHRGGRSAHHQKGMCRAKRIRRQFLRLLDYRNRMAEIIQRFHGIHIDSDAFFPQQFHQLRIPSASFMARHVKRYDPLLAEALQSAVNRCL